jgi:hypothetical protein
MAVVHENEWPLTEEDRGAASTATYAATSRRAAVWRGCRGVLRRQAELGATEWR